MTGAGDTDEFEEIPVDDDDPGDELLGADEAVPEVRDDDPTAGASDIGGRAGGADDDEEPAP